MANPPPNKLHELARIAWTKEDQKAFEQELNGSSDRAAAIIAAAYLETTVELMIRLFLQEKPSRGDDMILFGPTSALSSFAIKIRLSHLLGLIGPATRSDLLDITTTRNEFAHSAKSLDFTERNISKTCNSLKVHEAYVAVDLATPFKEGFANIPVRIKFLSTCMDIEAALRIHMYYFLQQRHLSLKRDARWIEKRVAQGLSIARIEKKHRHLS